MKKFYLCLSLALLSALLVALLGVAPLAGADPHVDIELCNVAYDGGLSVRLALATENCTASDTVGIEVRCDRPTADTAYEARYLAETTVNGKSYRVYSFADMTAADMTMELYLTPYVVSDAVRSYGEQKKISVLEYALKALGRVGDSTEIDDATKQKITDMLVDGAEMQRKNGTRTDRLATDEYYMLRTFGGVFTSDGFAKQLVKSGESAVISASPRDDVMILGWRDSQGNVLTESAEYTVAASGNETYTVIHRGFERSITYDAMGGVLPDGLPSKYVEGEGEIELAAPVREGYVFSGWYTSNDFKLENNITGIDTSTRGELHLYAKWNRIISSLDGNGIYANGKQALNEKTDTGAHKNGFSAADGVLTWRQGDSAASQMTLSGNIYAKIEGEHALTIEVTMARTSGKNVTPGQLRLRRADASFISVIYPFKITSNGTVNLGGQSGYTIAVIGEEMQTVRVVVDFKEETMTAYDEEGRSILTYRFTLPGTDADSMSAEQWLSKLTGTIWQFYSSSVGGGAELKIANITVIAGNSAERNARPVDTSEKLEELKAEIEQQRDKITSENLFGSSTADINLAGGESKMNKWGEAPYDPIDEHPRLYLTTDRIPAIRESIELMDEETKRRFANLLATELQDGAVLPEPVFAGTNATVDLDNIHNFNAGYLEIIQAKALGYLLYGNEYYGYQAIYYMKNYLESLDIVQIASDQCRQYGSVMNTAAIVYDWCYDLLTEEDKEQFIAGVENRICRYKNQIGAAMEVGFPPYGQGSVSGHGSERQILRDYLAFATAVYGDNDSWWDYVAARVCNDYAPVRNYYFQSGAVHQGTSYAVGRHISDLFSDWIITVATGNTPYNDYIKTAIKGMLGYEYADGVIFNDGDGTGDGKETSGYMHLVFIAAYLYGDSELLAHGVDMLGSGMISSDHNYLTSALYLSLAGLSDIEPAEDKYASMELIQYNGHPLGQYVIREAWGATDSAAVMMRIKERTTANHEHKDSGTFEIYYKGALSTDGGCYNNYGHFHTQQFHQATISHNGLIIFNPTKWNFNSSTVATKWYSGGQKATTGSSNLAGLMNPACTVAEIFGRQHGYIGEDKTKPQYAYIAGDLTKAYDSDTVDYVGRRMLTAYTGNEDFPMVFFVFDDITSDKVAYEKRFLLQISSNDAPTIDGNTVTTENGDGRLVLTCLSDKVVINGVGGRSVGDNGKYNAEISSNYLINGYQCVPKSVTADDGHWGRVEICYNGLYNRSTFMNVIYVTDKGQTKSAPAVEKITGVGIEGGAFAGVAAAFITSRHKMYDPVSFSTPGTGEMTYYVSGVASGEWTISVNGTSYGTATATADGGLLVFTAPAGSVTLTKK